MIESAQTDKELSVSNVQKSLQSFDWIDYVVFLLMLLSCAAVGVYFAVVDKNRRKRNVGDSNANDVAQEYLMGGKCPSVHFG